MINPLRGTKCTCSGCHERYYDLNRTPAICPKCGVELAPEKPRPVRPVRSPPMGRQRPVMPVALAEEQAEPEPAEADGDEDDVPEVDDDVDEDIEDAIPIDADRAVPD